MAEKVSGKWRVLAMCLIAALIIETSVLAGHKAEGNSDMVEGETIQTIPYDELDYNESLAKELVLKPDLTWTQNLPKKDDFQNISGLLIVRSDIFSDDDSVFQDDDGNEYPFISEEQFFLETYDLDKKTAAAVLETIYTNKISMEK